MTKEIGHDQPWMDRIDCDICTLCLHYKLERTCGSESESSGSYIGSSCSINQIASTNSPANAEKVLWRVVCLQAWIGRKPSCPSN